MNKKFSSQSGFTLLEVILSVSILVVMAIGASTLLRASFDMKFALSQNAQVTQSLSRVMQRLSKDIEHTYVINSRDETRFSIDRYGKTIFRYQTSDGGKLSLTTMSHIPVRKNAKESDLTYVVYELRKSEEYPGRTHLFRGEANFVSDDFNIDPPMELLARNIKTMNFEFWDGDRWLKDRWDSSEGEMRDKIPHMVRIKLEAWDDDPAEGRGGVGEENDSTDALQTIVYLSRASDFSEVKQGAANIKWY